MLDQAQFMRQFNETHREEFKPQLFERDNEEIVETVYNGKNKFKVDMNKEILEILIAHI